MMQPELVRCPYCGQVAELTQAGEAGALEWSCTNQDCGHGGRVIQRVPWQPAPAGEV